MAVVMEPQERRQADQGNVPGSGRIFSHCANPRCRTGWFQLWRSRGAPRFGGRWTCSAECLQELVRTAVVAEMGARDGAPAMHIHRLPLGLALVEQGYLAPGQLRHAVESRRRAEQDIGAAIPLGNWLLRSGLVSEIVLTRTIGSQWGCPALSLQRGYRPADVVSALPRLLADAFGAIPLRAAQSGLLFVGFTAHVDRSLAYAMERILGMRVIPGILPDSVFEGTRSAYFAEPGPAIRMAEARDPFALARMLSGIIEREKPLHASLAGIHGYGWLRMWKSESHAGRLPDRSEVVDILCTIRDAPADH